MSRAAIRAAILHMLPAYLASVDLDAEPIFRQAGMTADDVRSSKIVYRAQATNVLALTADAAGMAEIALTLGALADPDKLGPTGLAMKAGATLEGCLHAHRAWMPNMQSGVELGLHQEGAEAVLTHRLLGDDEAAWLLYEGAAAFYFRMLRHLLGKDWTPERVSFPHACKGRKQIYEEFFGAPVLFGRDEEARITFPREELSKPLAGRCGHGSGGGRGPPPLGEFRLSAGDVEIAVARMIAATLPDKPIGLPETAAVLGLSARTLQRRLGETGVTFEQMVDAQRHAIAIERLAGSEASVTAIAMRLGYSDVAHFNRAFRRWEGRSPTDFRRSRSSASRESGDSAIRI